MDDKAQVLVAVQPLHKCTIQHKIWFATVFSLKNYHRCLAEFDTKLLQHLPQHSTLYSIERFLEVNKTTKQLASFPFQSCLPLFVVQGP